MKLLGKKKMKLARIVFLFWLPIILLIVGVMGYRMVHNSLFFSQQDRIQILLYGKNTSVISLGLHDNVFYRSEFPADLKITIPGGYGFYRVGAIGKLQSLQNDMQLAQRSFSYASGAMIHYYFFIPDGTIFYGSNTNDTSPLANAQLFLTGTSNAQFLDRIFLLLFFMQKKEALWKDLTVSSFSKNDEIYLDQIGMMKKWQGYFFDSTLRRENASIQLEYDQSYDAVQNIASLLDGSGIRVSDMSQRTNKDPLCTITTGKNAVVVQSTVQALRSFFHCAVNTGDTGIYDILFSIGNLEKDWK